MKMKNKYREGISRNHKTFNKTYMEMKMKRKNEKGKHK